MLYRFLVIFCVIYWLEGALTQFVQHSIFEVGVSSVLFKTALVNSLVASGLSNCVFSPCPRVSRSCSTIRSGFHHRQHATFVCIPLIVFPWLRDNYTDFR